MKRISLIFALCLFLGACGSSDAAQGGLPNATPVAGYANSLYLVSSMTFTTTATANTSTSIFNVKAGDVLLICGDFDTTWTTLPTTIGGSLQKIAGTAAIFFGVPGRTVVYVGMSAVNATKTAGAACIVGNVDTPGTLMLRSNLGSTGGTGQAIVANVLGYLWLQKN